MILSKYALALYLCVLAMFSASAETTELEDLAGLFLGATFLFERSLNKSGFKLPWSQSFIFLILFLILSLLTVFYHPDSARRLLTFVFTIFLFYLVYGVSKTIESYKALVLGLGAGVAWLVTNHYEQIALVASGLSVERFGAGFNQNVFAFLLIFFILLLIRPVFAGSKISLIQKGIGLFFLLAASYLIVFTGSRKGIVFLVLVLTAFLAQYLSYVTLLKKFVIIILLILISIPVLSWLVNSPFYFRLENLFLMIQGDEVQDTSMDIRGGMVEIGVKLFLEKPILGWGFDAFRHVSGYRTYSHNNYIELLANGGAIGFLLYYMFYIYIIIQILYSKYVLKRHKGLLNWSLLCLLILMAFSFGAVTYTSKIAWMISALVLGTVANLKRHKHPAAYNNSDSDSLSQNNYI